MINLCLAILSSAAISVLMRIGDPYIKNNMIMFVANYAVCGLLSFLFLVTDEGITFLSIAGIDRGAVFFAVGLGLFSGVMYLMSFVLLQLNIRKNGLVLASTFMKLGVLVPVTMSVILGWDLPTKVQILGCALAIAAILLINGEGYSEGEKKLSGIWLVILLLSGGFTDSLANIYDKLGEARLKNHYLLCIFVAAVLLSIFFTVVKKQKFTWMDTFWGILIGIPNYFSARFLLLS